MFKIMVLQALYSLSDDTGSSDPIRRGQIGPSDLSKIKHSPSAAIKPISRQ
jgi:hypothetical protein